MRTNPLKTTVLTVVALSSLLALSACGNATQKDDSGSSKEASAAATKTSEDSVPTVVTTFTVLQDMAKNVAGKHLKVESVVSPGEEIHDYQPSPDDIKKAVKAKLVLANGLGLERWFKRFTAQSNAPVAIVSEGVQPIDIQEGEYKGKPNPHAWMSPSAGLIYVDNIAKAFSKIDPAHSSDYQANAAAYKKQISDINQKMMKNLETLDPKQRVLVTCEGAFSYLARDTNLKEKYLWGVNAEGALTPKRMADVQNYVKENKVPAVFCESTVGDKMQPVAEATGAKFGGLLYVDSLTTDDGPAPTYLKLLQYDTELISKQLSGK